MTLDKQSIDMYLAALASELPAPGGGSASALCGAQGAALTAMVANLTLGKKKYEQEQEVCRLAACEALELKEKLQIQIERDTQAYNLVCSAFKLPKETTAEQALRSQKIAEATLAATEMPFRTMQLAQEVLRLTRSLVGRSNVNAASDLGVAALNLLCCIKGAWLNVLINLSGLKDENIAAEFLSKGRSLLEEAEKTEHEILNLVIESL